MSEQEEPQPTVFCAWCRRVMAWGTAGIGHGLCDECLPAVAEAIEMQLALKDSGRPSSRPAWLPGAH